MKVKSSIIGAISLISLIMCSTLVSSVGYNTWGISIGDKFQWNYFDNYYSIESYNDSESVSIAKSYIDNTMKYRAEYEIVKDWKSGDLVINVSSSDINVNIIQINITYYTIGGSAKISRNYTNYDGELITTIIPAQIDVLANELYREPYKTQFDKEVETIVEGSALILDLTTGDYSVPTSIGYSTVGTANITYYNSISKVHQLGYAFHYVSSSSNINRDLLKSYEGFGSSIEILDLKDFPNDEDEDLDLVVMNEIGVSVETPAGDYGISIPNYFDISTFTSIGSLISFLLSFTGDATSLLGLALTVPMGFSLPSGMNIVYSDVDKILNTLLEISPDFVNDIVQPILTDTFPNLTHFFQSVYENGFTISTLYNALILVSLTNLLVLPESIDLDELEDNINELSTSLNAMTPFLGTTDLSNLAYTLGNSISCNRDGAITEITINSEALPLLWDSNKGLTALSLSMKWKGNIFDRLDFNMDFISANLSHILGFQYDDGSDESSTSSWTKKLSDAIIIVVGILSGGGIAIIIKKKNQKPGPFKSVISGLRSIDNCPNGFCKD